MELSKNDWKLFRERLPGWQERYMDKLTREYAEFLTDDSCQPSERFWTLNRRIREDRRRPGVQLELRKQNVAFDLAHLIADGAVSQTYAKTGLKIAFPWSKPSFFIRG